MTDRAGRAFIDTNVWVYAADSADPEKQRRALAIVDPASGYDLVLSAQVVGEFYVTVTRKLAKPMTQEAALAAVRTMNRQHVVPLDSRLVEAAVVGAAGWRLSYWDALVIVAARSVGAELLLTDDLQHGSVIEGVRIVNPFLPTDPSPEA